MTFSSSVPRFARLYLAGGLAIGLAALSGCGNEAFTPGATTSAVVVAGKAMGGETPVVHSTITLYASGVATGVSNGVYTGTATVLGTVTGGDDGSFSFNASNYTCPANQILYITAYGGNAGAGTNNNILAVAPIGTCDSLNGFTDVNELTSLATAYAFSSFMSIDTSGAAPVVNIVAPAANASFASNSLSSGTVSKASGLVHAYQNAINLVDMTHGTAYAVPPSNPGAVGPNLVLNSLGNTLQACVNSTGGIASNPVTQCGNLFHLTPSLDGMAPTNTLQAALNLARNPYVSDANVLSLYIAALPQMAFAPALPAQPHDWTLAISYPVPPNPVSGVGFPFMLALDADDNVFVTSPENDPWAPFGATKSTTNSTSACLFGWTSNGSFRPAITPYSGAAGIPGTVGTGTPGTSSWFCSGSQAATSQTDYLLTNLAVDNTGTVWIHNYGSGTATPAQDPVVKVSNSGVWQAQYIPPVQTGATQAFQNVGIVVDKSNNVWFNALSASTGVPNVIAFAAGAGGTSSVGSALTIGSISTGPTFASSGRGLAFDSLQNFIGASYGGSSGGVGTLSLGGTGLYLPITGATGANPANYGTVFKKAVGGGSTSGGTGNDAPWGVAVDSANNDWFTASGATGQTITSGSVGLFELVPTGTPYTSTTTGTSLTTGFTSPKGVEVDGNSVVWVADTTGIVAYGSTLSTPAFISESGGFKPCISTANTCTYPDNANSKGIVVDSTGSVWWTTPDTVTVTANSNRLIQLIGTGTATWPLMATGKPGTMPQ